MHKILDHGDRYHFDIATVQGHHTLPVVLHVSIGLLQIAGMARLHRSLTGMTDKVPVLETINNVHILRSTIA